ncbi:helix-turn-helix transcriptional regulator [Kribbella sp. NPDC051718]|uniref:helix-turn-helix domain-containing protein n=1 Tax=Kribbella sp. NPDC051718 TaxID=3155168 RepID=UPI00342BF925
MQLNTEALKALRLAGGHTQASLAERTGISENAYLAIEQGKAHPRVSTVNKLAAALGLTLDEFRSRTQTELVQTKAAS